MSETLTIGSALPELALPPISRTTLGLFACGPGDHNPIHIDVARGAGFDDVFAQGMLSMAHPGRLLTDSIPLSAIRSLQVRFAAITPVHGQPTCRGTVRDLSAVDGKAQATLDLEVTLADGTVTLQGSAVVALD